MSKTRRWAAIFALGAANGIIYVFPYIQFTYYDTMQAALGATHTQMGNLVSIYGTLNIVFYLLGGLILDKIGRNKLLIMFSLIATGITGLSCAFYMSYSYLMILTVLWAITTLLTFWSPFVNAKRQLGTMGTMSKVFGFSEAFSMVVGMISTATGLIVFTRFNDSFSAVLVYIGILHLVVAVAILFLLPKDHVEPKKQGAKTAATTSVGFFEGFGRLIKRPEIWLLGLIIFAQYATGITIGRIAPYLTNVFHVSAIIASVIAIANQYVVPIVGPTAGGIIADKMKSATKYMKFNFVAVAILIFLLTLVPPVGQFVIVAVIIFLFARLLQVSLRSTIFVPLSEFGTPEKYAGTAIGIVSVIGYSPDAFLATIWGKILDANAGNEALGFKIIFFITVGIAVLGFICSFILERIIKKQTYTIKAESVAEVTV